MCLVCAVCGASGASGAERYVQRKRCQRHQAARALE